MKTPRLDRLRLLAYALIDPRFEHELFDFSSLTKCSLAWSILTFPTEWGYMRALNEDRAESIYPISYGWLAEFRPSDYGQHNSVDSAKHFFDLDQKGVDLLFFSADRGVKWENVTREQAARRILDFCQKHQTPALP